MEAETEFAQNSDYRVTLRDRRNRVRFWIEDALGVEISKSITDLSIDAAAHYPDRETIWSSRGHGDLCVAASPRVVRAGIPVSIICEQVMAEVSREIDVIQVEKCREKRRWKSMLIFRRGWTPSYKTGSGARISSSIAMSAQYPIR